MNKSLLFGFIGVLIGIGISWIVFSTIDQDIEVPQQPVSHDMSSTQMHSAEGMTMDSMVQNLEGKTGDEFDKEFIKGMIEHHQGAVEMAKLAEQNAKHQEIKDLSKDIISAQEKEIELMNQWKTSWGY